VTALPVELVIFDFDGTLAHRPGMWTKCLADVLADYLPDNGVPIDDLRLLLREGFPWHTPELDHTHVKDPDQWWRLLQPTFERAFAAVGADRAATPTLMAAIRSRYCDPHSFKLYDDTLEALELLRQKNARAVILSNHVPELPRIVDGLGLGDLVDDVLTSAIIGYEKPHPEAFRLALGSVPPERACMIGDNPVADIAGAQRIGARAVLVRHPDADHHDVRSAVAALPWT
jgi:HAD superfamily hydrolase (TIGR01549 family)